jgi:hypothetical protein
VCAAVVVASVVLGAVALAPLGRAADPADPVLYVLQALAEDAGASLIVGDVGAVTQADPAGDAGTDRGFDDIVSAGIASLPTVPPWLLAAFDCDAANVACARGGSLDSRFSGGALVVGQRMTEPPARLPAGQRGEWGPTIALDQYPTAPLGPDDPFAGASHAVITRIDGDERQVRAFAYLDDAFTGVSTNARSMWVGDDLLTLIPVDEELLTPPVGWDVVAMTGDDSTTARDTIRGLDGAPLLALAGPLPEVTFEEAASPTPASSASAAASASQASPEADSPSPSASASPSVAPSASVAAASMPAAVISSPRPSSSPVSALAGLWDDPTFRLLLGLILALLGLALLVRRTRSRPPPGNPDSPPD